MDERPDQGANTPDPNLTRTPRFKAVPIRVIVPNLVTLMALAMGLTAIRFAVEGRFETAVLFIIGAAVLDGLDGRIARALKATSRFGAELDSLADFVDFGVAPALTLYLWSLHDIKSFGWFAALVFAIAAALRLARFNVMIEDPNKPAWAGNFFVGMPAPAAACLALMPLYLHYSVLHLPVAHKLAPYHIAYVLLLAFLMVSRIPHFSGKRIGRVPREYFVFILLGIVAIGILLATWPMEVLVVLCLGYLAMIPFSVRRHNAFLRADLAVAANDTPPVAGEPAEKPRE